MRHHLLLFLLLPLLLVVLVNEVIDVSVVEKGVDLWMRKLPEEVTVI